MKLKPGDKAPEFKGVTDKEETISLADFKGKKLALYFYPKDDTPGCTAEACSLRDGYSQLRKEGVAIVGVSPDKVAKHKKFVDKYDLPFPLIADESHEIMENYGVWGLKKFMGREYMGVIRTSFLIDEEGQILHIIDKVKTKDHANQILDLLRTS